MPGLPGADHVDQRLLGTRKHFIDAGQVQVSVGRLKHLPDFAGVLRNGLVKRNRRIKGRARANRLA